MKFRPRIIALQALLGVASALLSGCAPVARPITYEVSRVARGNAIAPDKVLNVRILSDMRRRTPGNTLLFSGGPETKFEGKRVCVNAETQYQAGTVPRQITALVARHIRQRGIFKGVVYGDNAGVDYQLVGELTTFYARQDYDYGAAVGSSFGLIGAAATANNRERTEIRIALTGFVLYDRAGNALGRLSDAIVYKIQDEPSDAYCTKVYDAANRFLFDAVSSLASSLEELLKTVERG